MHLGLLFSLVFVLLILTDICLYVALKSLFKGLNGRIFFWISCITIIFFILFLLINGPPGIDYERFANFFIFSSLIILVYVPKHIFLSFVLLQKAINLITRLKNRIFSMIGLGIGILVLTIIIYGIVWGKYDIRISNVEIPIKNLPESFDGFKIVQFSDAHLGSFKAKWKVRRGLTHISKQSPDMIVFTGDLINISSTEALPHITYFKDLQANYGKFSILGNHDMNDYRKIDSLKASNEDLKRLGSIYEDMGFRLLQNEHQFIKKGNDSIAIVGVENWGLPPFKQAGDLFKAIEGIEDNHVKILLSHDPSHWDEEIVPFTNIDLTLSGHTHGMQFGINTKVFKWSPIKRLYKRWIGLHKVDDQYLYVNTGFGFIGFAGRIGIRPEISVFTLRKAN